jgi:hypothetical protein
MLYNTGFSKRRVVAALCSSGIGNATNLLQCNPILAVRNSFHLSLEAPCYINLL